MESKLNINVEVSDYQKIRTIIDTIFDDGHLMFIFKEILDDKLSDYSDDQISDYIETINVWKSDDDKTDYNKADKLTIIAKYSSLG